MQNNQPGQPPLRFAGIAVLACKETLRLPEIANTDYRSWKRRINFRVVLSISGGTVFNRQNVR
jgi:hypothetical protein